MTTPEGRRPFDLKGPAQTRELIESIPVALAGWDHANPRNDNFPLEQHFFTINRIRPTDGTIGSKLAVSIDKSSGLIEYISVTDLAPIGEADLGNNNHFVLIPKTATVTQRQDSTYLDFVGTQQGKDAIVRVDSNGNVRGEVL